MGDVIKASAIDIMPKQDAVFEPMYHVRPSKLCQRGTSMLNEDRPREIGILQAPTKIGKEVE